MHDVELVRGRVPLLISLPHDGTDTPAEIAARMTPAALAVPDTDWHVYRLYAGLAEALGASLIRPRWSRYVVDLNRPPDDASLYPGQRVTGLVPRVTFADEPIYRDGAEPDDAEVAARVERYWRPYHSALAGELERLRATHGHVVLWEGHSIRSRVPMLFDGRLPDLNLGTVDGHSCTPAMRARLAAVLATDSRHTHAVDGRFKGGYITRHYANPARGIEAVQLEIAQVTYLDEASFVFDEVRAVPLVETIGRLLEASLAA
jgi:N-formylglutamate deformylase